MKAAQFWNVDNVKSFRGYDVNKGEVYLSESEFEEVLDDIYGTIKIMGMEYGTGSTLSGVDPVAFRCAQGEHESQLQAELEEQLEREDSDNIEFIDGDEFELDEESDDE